MTIENLEVDILKLNHFLNARKITTKQIFSKNKSLYKKLVVNKNFKPNQNEIKFLEKKNYNTFKQYLCKKKIT